MTEYVYNASMRRKGSTPKVYWSDSLFIITAFVRCKLAKGWTMVSNIEKVDKIHVMMFPSQEVKIFSDINGNQYVLTKEIYVNVCNSATVTLNDTKYDIMERFLWNIRKFVKDRNFITLIESMNALVIEERYDQNIDKFTFGALAHHIQQYRIHPVGGRSNAILCCNGNKADVSYI